MGLIIRLKNEDFSGLGLPTLGNFGGLIKQGLIRWYKMLTDSQTKDDTNNSELVANGNFSFANGVYSFVNDGSAVNQILTGASVSNYTMAMVIKPELTHGQYLVGHENNDGANVYMNTSGNLYIQGNDAQGGNMAIMTPLQMTNDTWQPLIVSFSGNDMTFDIDGNSVTETFTSSIGNPQDVILFGSTNAGQSFSGDIAYLLLYDRELSQGEREGVTQHMRKAVINKGISI